MIYEYDENNQLIKVDNETIYLTNNENILFSLLYKSQVPVSKEKIFDTLYYGYMYRENTISSSIARLRKKLKDKFIIKAVSNVGYYIKPNSFNACIERMNMPTKLEEEYYER